jgi:hypothetical protein
MHRVLPWARSQFILIDGQPFVYTTDADGEIALVHLPGGRSATVEELRAEGRTVVLPTWVRRS